MRRSAVVTGGTSGIGRAAAIALAGAGWWVLATGRDETRGEEVGAELADRGEFLAADLTEAGVPETLVEHAGRTAPLGLLVNCAGMHFLAIEWAKGELLEKWSRDSKILDIFEGTQQIQQLIVARRILGLSSAQLK